MSVHQCPRCHTETEGTREPFCFRCGTEMNEKVTRRRDVCRSMTINEVAEAVEHDSCAKEKMIVFTCPRCGGILHHDGADGEHVSTRCTHCHSSRRYRITEVPA